MVKVRLKLVALGIAFVVPALAFIYSHRSSAKLNDSPKAIVEEAWQLVQREYVDRSFNSQDWQAVRKEYLSQKYSSHEAAYEAKLRDLERQRQEAEEYLNPRSQLQRQRRKATWLHDNYDNETGKARRSREIARIDKKLERYA